MSLNDELELLNSEYAKAQGEDHGFLKMLKAIKSGSIHESNTLFQGRVIRILNNIYQRLNYSSSQVLSELELKISADVSQAEQRSNALINKIETRLSILEDKLNQSQNQIDVLDSVTKGLESIVSLLGNQGDRTASASSTPKQVNEADFNYLLLENRFRGSENAIKEKLIPYAELIKSSYFNGESKEKVLEVGCGRGEFLELLLERNIPCLGLEIDTGMHALTKHKKLEVVLDDAVNFISSFDGSLLGISAFQVVEHLKYPYLLEFLSSSFSKIKSGGFLLLETINTSSLIPLMQNYFRDPTHTAPLHPDTLCFLIEQAGFKVKTIHKSAHFPKEAVLQNLPETPELPFRYQELTRQINSRIDVLNRLLFDSQDYAVEAYKP